MILLQTRNTLTANIDDVGEVISCPCLFHMCTSLESVISLKGFPSVKRTRPLCKSVQFLCLCHYRKWRLRCAGVNYTHRAGKWNTFLQPSDHGKALYRASNRPLHAFSPAVWRLSLLDCRNRYRLYAAIVVREKPLLHIQTAVLVVLNVIQARDTMLWAIQNSSAKSHLDFILTPQWFYLS